MKSVRIPALTLMVLSFAGAPVFAQQSGVTPLMQSHTVNPGVSLSDPATSPLQQQMQDDYASGLQATQRNLLQQNPSGLSPGEIAIGHQLNGFTPH